MGKFKAAHSSFTKAMSSTHASGHANAIQIAGGGLGGAAYVNEKHVSESQKRYQANKGSH